MLNKEYRNFVLQQSSEKENFHVPEMKSEPKVRAVSN